MKTRVKLFSLTDGTISNNDVQLSSICPCCGVHLSPQILYGAIIEYDDEEENKVFILNYCPECNECFISKHIFDEESCDGYSFEYAAPMNHFQHSFSDAISNLSPDFVAIYNESLKAEELGLTSICGMGYRKALEFLVKDYIIHNDSSKESEVATKLLMSCINDYITNDRLKSLAKASAWLGNDQTHYVKKHKDYGTEDLKAFINAFVTFIDADLAYENALKLISN